MIHLMIWTCLNTSLVKVTLNQPGEERWSSLLSSLASIRVATPMAGSSGDGSNTVSGIEGTSPSSGAGVEGADLDPLLDEWKEHKVLPMLWHVRQK